MRFLIFALALGIAAAPVRAVASVTVTVNGSSYTIPQTNEKGWGTNVTSWIQAISAAALYPGSGTYTLIADLDFGSNYGLKSLYYKTRSSNIASAGQFRLANTDLIEWRNAANSGDLSLGVDTSNRLTFNGSPFLPTAALTASRALVSDASGVVGASGTTTTQLQYLNAATGTTGTTSSSIVFSASPTFTGTFTGPWSTAGPLITSSGGVVTSEAQLAIARGGTGASSTSQNFAFIGPTSGSGAPSFRTLVAGDIPSLAASAITSGTLATARGGTNLDTSASTGVPLITSGTWSVLGTTGTGSVARAASPTFSGTLTAAAITGTGALAVSGARSLFTANSEPYSVGAQYGSGTGTYYMGATNSASTPSMVWSNNAGTQKMELTDGGKLGIGGTPSQLLDVISSNNLGARIAVASANSFTGIINLYLANTNTTANNTSEIASSNGNGSVDGSMGFVHVVHSATVPQGAWVVGTANGSTTVTERYRVQPPGDLKMGSVTSTTVPTLASGEMTQYRTGSKWVTAYNDAGTIRYKYLDMSGTGVTWVHTTTAP